MFEKVCELPQYQHFIIALMVQLFYFGVNVYVLKSKKIKAHSLEEATLNKLKKWVSMPRPIYIEETKVMELSNGLVIDYKEGALQLEYVSGALTGTIKVQAAAVINPILESFKAKVESGEVDPIKGTDLDKTIMLQAIAFLQAELNK